MARKTTKKRTAKRTAKRTPKRAAKKTAKATKAKATRKVAAKRAGPRVARVPVSTAAAEASVPVIEVPNGGTLQVIVDVGPMAVPYTIAYNGHTVIKAMVDQTERVPLEPGSHLLGWDFEHAVPEGWEHSLGYSINGGPTKVLEKKSAANEDPRHSNGIALVRS